MTNYPTGSPRGPAPKPTALKILHGDDKHNPQRVNRNEPRPTRNWIVAPNTLSTGARECWDELVPELLKCGIITSVDSKMFAEFCEATVVVKLARIQVMRMMTGEYEPKAGAANPFNSYARAIGVLTSLGGRFGLTPADRSRLITDSVDTDDLISTG